MKIDKLISNVKVKDVHVQKDINCENICINSKQVTKNSLFICLNGEVFDGNDYIDDAINNGANVVISDKDILNKNLNYIIVENSRKAYSLISSNFYGNPANKLNIIAVVGTNGKSSTAYILYHILKDAGLKVGLIGTMYIEFAGVKIPAEMTTPDPHELQCIFWKMLNSGIKYVVMEVSAHAIFYNKLFGVYPKYKILTNLSQDHLDFFKTMDNYKKCKKSYFLDDDSIKIVNLDDSLGIEIARECKNVITYGINNPSDVFCVNYKNNSDGSAYVLNLLDSIIDISTRLIGVCNVYNAMAAAICAKTIGVSDYCIEKTLSTIKPPEGRFNIFVYNSVKYIIDFAHTPEGLKNVLIEARNLAQNRVIVVFGCGGNRDKLKRPIMGSIAALYSDLVILTSDNPRFEDRNQIIQDILSGIENTNKVCIEDDRSKAIDLVRRITIQGDVVVIAGKGCENYMDEKGEKKFYSDFEEVRKIGI